MQRDKPVVILREKKDRERGRAKERNREKREMLRNKGRKKC